MTFYSLADPVKYEGPDSRNPLAFRFYDAKRKILGNNEHIVVDLENGHIEPWQRASPARALEGRRERQRRISRCIVRRYNSRREIGISSGTPKLRLGSL